MADERSKEQVAAELARFLTTRDRYGGTSPLDTEIAAQITVMTREIAREIIANTPELRGHIQGIVERLVYSALQTDSWLNATIVNAVAKALTDLALERERERTLNEE